MNVVAIFDIGKTNKKAFLFDEEYQIVWENSTNLTETVDEDGFACENLKALEDWFFDCLQQMKSNALYNIKAINFSTYGASFVYIDLAGKSLTHLYNYLKPFPETLQDEFYTTYRGKEHMALKTASPVLGSLNSGLQLYRLKKENKLLFNEVKYGLHLPQYMSFLLTNESYSDMTSIGCHTKLWNFKKMKYHKWVLKEGIDQKLAPIRQAEDSTTLSDGTAVGVGLHDSSSALIPYMLTFKDPFVLLSTGTWVISMNPFNEMKLNAQELENECLCFLNYKGKPVKASRLFLGNEHEIQTLRLAQYFKVSKDTFKNVAYNSAIIEKLRHKLIQFSNNEGSDLKSCPFINRDLSLFESYEEAYHQLILDIIAQQLIATEWVIYNSPVKQLFVDGGFSKNSIYMNLLAEAYPTMAVYAASVPQASALGAAMVVHKTWNSKAIPNRLIKLNYFTSDQFVAIN